MRIVAIAILLAVSLPVLVYGGEISDLYSKQGRGKTHDWRKSRSHAEADSTNHSIREIGVERSGCFGTCPIYTFIVKSDGTFRYNGQNFVERKGEFTGTIERWRFNHLAQFIHDAGYMELEDSYRRGVTDMPTVYTTVVMNDQRKIISNYANAGPTKLWAIEELIDGLMSKAKWNSPNNVPK